MYVRKSNITYLGYLFKMVIFLKIASYRPAFKVKYSHTVEIMILNAQTQAYSRFNRVSFGRNWESHSEMMKMAILKTISKSH